MSNTAATRDSLTHRTLHGLFWTTSGVGAQGLVQALVMVVLARILTPHDYGVVGAGAVIIGLSSVFSQMGVGPAIVQRPELGSCHVRVGFTLSVALGIAMSLLLTLTAPLVASFFRMPELEKVVPVLSLAFVLQGLSVVSESLLQRELSFRTIAGINVVSYVLGYGLVGIALALKGFGYWALVSASLAQTSIRTLLLLWERSHALRFSIKSDAFKELFGFGSGYTLVRIANYTANQGDSLVVGRCLGAEALGEYGRAFQLLIMPTQLFGQVMDRVLFPAMATVQQEPERLAIAYRRSVAFAAMLMLPVSTVLFVLAPEMIRVLLGGQWDSIVVPFRILIVGLLFRTSYKMSDSLARATGAVYRTAWRHSIYAALILSGTYVGHFWGLAGVSIGALVAVICNYLLMAHLSLSLTGLSWKRFAHAQLQGVTMGVITISVCGLSAALLRACDLPSILVLAGSGFVTCGVLLFLCIKWPDSYLGEDGHWMLAVLSRYFPRTRRNALTAVDTVPAVSSTDAVDQCPPWQQV